MATTFRPKADISLPQMMGTGGKGAAVVNSETEGVQLELFIHQVGGRSSMFIFNNDEGQQEDTLCKILVEREVEFYQTMPSSLAPFVPTFRGIIAVEYESHPSGYLVFKAYRLFQPNGSEGGGISSEMTSPTSGVSGLEREAGIIREEQSMTRNVRKIKQMIKLREDKEEEGTTRIEIVVIDHNAEEEDAEEGAVSWRGNSAEVEGKGGATATVEAVFEGREFWEVEEEEEVVEDASKGGSDKGNDTPSTTSPTKRPKEKRYNPWIVRCHHRNLLKLKSSQAAHQMDTSPPLSGGGGGGGGGCSGSRQKFILLENLTSKYTFPCVLDLKVGVRMWDDYATEAKIASHRVKVAATTSAPLGLRIGGMQVYNHQLGRFKCYNKYDGRSLDVEGFRETLRNYFSDGIVLRTHLIAPFVARIRELREIISKLDTFRFFTSSLLIVYEGKFRERDVGEDKDGDEMRMEMTRYNLEVRCIDFAHSTHSGLANDKQLNDGPDDGYIYGLNHLIEELEYIIDPEIREKVD